MNQTKPTWGDRDRYYAVDQYQQSRAGRDDGDSLTRRLEARVTDYCGLHGHPRHAARAAYRLKTISR